MLEHVISVLPVEGGWRVEWPFAGHALMFHSGARAEQKARSLGRQLAQAGHCAQVLVHDRRQTLVGALRYAASFNRSSS